MSAEWGEIYRTGDPRLGRDVVVKILSNALANDADYMARFRREAQALAALSHPNIATLYGVRSKNSNSLNSLLVAR